MRRFAALPWANSRFGSRPDLYSLLRQTPVRVRGDRTLSRRDRQIAIHLAKQHATSWVAKKFRVSASRISQLRRELYEAWHRFHGEAPEEDSPPVLSAT